jgi:hypothetical protein
VFLQNIETMGVKRLDRPVREFPQGVGGLVDNPLFHLGRCTSCERHEEDVFRFDRRLIDDFSVPVRDGEGLPGPGTSVDDVDTVGVLDECLLVRVWG